MKSIKRLISAMLAFVMVLAMGSFSYADPDPETESPATPATRTITIKDTGNHNYVAYQIFDGDVNNGTLSNVSWGADVTVRTEPAATITPAAALEWLKDKSSGPNATWGDDFVKYLSDNGITLKNPGQSFTKSESAGNDGKYTYTATNLDPGYYLVKDTADLTGKADEAYTSYLVQVIDGDATLNPKKDVPTLEKKVHDVNDSDSTVDTSDNWKDSADYDIGDHVPFKLTGTLPENFDEYTTYKYVFHDYESAGLTFDGENSVHVYIDGKEVDPGSYTVTTPGADSKCTFEVKFDNLKGNIMSKAGEDNDPPSTKINITSSSVITVEYTSLLNSSANIGSAGNPNEARLEFSNNPNSDGEGTTGTTPNDKVTVFTFELVIDKVQPDPDSSTPNATKPLEGAQFKIQKWNGTTWVDSTITATVVDNKFTFKGLDDGRYKIVETVTPPGFNTIDPIYIKVEATHDTTSDDPELTSLTVTVTNEDGSAKNGADTTFTVETDGKCADTNHDKYTGDITADILNQAGSQLPSTGGMGTRLFYTLGAILVIGAGVLLITKRRMKNA